MAEALYRSRETSSAVRRQTPSAVQDRQHTQFRNTISERRIPVKILSIVQDTICRSRNTSAAAQDRETRSLPFNTETVCRPKLQFQTDTLTFKESQHERMQHCSNDHHRLEIWLRFCVTQQFKTLGPNHLLAFTSDRKFPAGQGLGSITMGCSNLPSGAEFSIRCVHHCRPLYFLPSKGLGTSQHTSAV